MSFNTRVRLVVIVFGLVYLGLLAKLFYWQIISNEKLSAQADDQHFYTQLLPAKRGEIKFADLAPLVSNKQSYLLYANLIKVTGDKNQIANELATILAPEVPLVSTTSAEVSSDEQNRFLKDTEQQLQQKFYDKLTLPNAVWMNLAHFISRQSQEKINQLNLPGLSFTDEQNRDYPESSMAAHVVGFVGSDQNGNPKGYFGLEGFYDRELSGRPGEIRIEKDAFGRPIAIGSEERQNNQNGHDLVTTIDRSAQLFVEKELQQGISDWKATGGTAIVLNPQDGAIIAMANFPRYDPANFSYFPTSWYKNPAIADLYEPGSIMKPMIMAAAINEGKVTPDTHCTQCNGPAPIGGYLIHTFNNSYHPNSTMTEVLINSDNTGMIFVGKQLGFDKLYDYLQKYGFGKPTGVDLEEEEGSSLRPKSNYVSVDQATIAFGQGIAVNSLQMVRALSTIANGGYLVTPHLVQRIITDKETITLPWPKGQRVISETTAKTVAEMLVRVADESPEHFPKDRIKELSNYRIAAKSGTAQIAVGGAYAKQGTNATLIGFFPAENPRFVVFVKLNEPEVRPWGSDTAGPVFFSIIRDLIEYYGIPPQ